MIIDRTELYLAHHKIVVDKLSGFGWISQVKLEDNQLWSNTSNFVLQSWLTLFTDWAMTNIHFFTPLFLIGFVPPLTLAETA